MVNQIVWQAKAGRLYRSYQEGALDKFATGGNAYEFHALQALRRRFKVTMDEEAVRGAHESALSYWNRMRRHRVSADLLIKDPHVTTLGRLGTARAEIAVLHHIDYELKNHSLKHRWFFNRLLRRLPRLSAVVTVSEFWREELRKLGCQRVEVIYNAFDLREFEFAAGEDEHFKQSYGFSSDRPLVYIGNASPRKGASEVYHALKNEGFTLVMTGREKGVDVPVRWLHLDRHDYLRLLHACDVVVMMSSLLEGWNRVAHEAMLCQTPVIGSGIGGMRELLEGGHQVVLENIAELPEAVRSVLAQKEKRAACGYNYAKQFDTNYFERAWTALASSLMGCIDDRSQRASVLF